jgi:methylated-DNA-[protein]-cysteine S-methyltransferase
MDKSVFNLLLRGVTVGNVFMYKTEIGWIGITDNGSAITSIKFEKSLDLQRFKLEEQMSVNAKTEIGKDGLRDIQTQKITQSSKSEESEEIKVFESELIKNAYIQLCEYLAGHRKELDFPIDPSGTEFQCRVWNALRSIPYGETMSYSEIAQTLGNKKACRAVGMANNKNPIPIVIPCHRVIGSDGKLVGYAGGLEVKQLLLDLEKRESADKAKAPK